MDFEKNWLRALKHTEIIRSRVQALMTFADTAVPYILLSESTINPGDTAVRKGNVVIQKPSLILPPHLPQFEGFDFFSNEDASENYFINFLLVRGVTLPSLKYNNKTSSLEIYEGKLSEAITHFQDILEAQENVHTGLLAGPEDCWQFSLLIFICAQVAKNADSDIRKILEEYKKRGSHE